MIYLDGTATSDRMRLLLLSGAVIFRGYTDYEEFYTYLLNDKVISRRPKNEIRLHFQEHYIEYHGVEELKVWWDFFQENPNYAIEMRENNRRFIENNFHYDQIMLYFAKLLNLLI